MRICSDPYQSTIMSGFLIVGCRAADSMQLLASSQPPNIKITIITYYFDHYVSYEFNYALAAVNMTEISHAARPQREHLQ